MKMRIAVMGAGGVGGCLGALLSRAGVQGTPNRQPPMPRERNAKILSTISGPTAEELADLEGEGRVRG